MADQIGPEALEALSPMPEVAPGSAPSAETDKVEFYGPQEGLYFLPGVETTEISTVEPPEAKHTDRTNEVFRLTRDPKTFEVTVDSDITLEDYKRITSEENWNLLEKYAEKMQGKKVVFINPTMEGGGVAMLRPPLVNMLKRLGVDAHWYVMDGRREGDPNPFLVTKKIHNIAQRRLAPSERLTDDDKETHKNWADQNAETLVEQKNIQSADVIVIDDPQPAPMFDKIKAVNPNSKIVWRNHIDTSGKLMSDPNSPQGEVADYIFKELGIGNVDAMIAHPVDAFVHPDYADKTYFAPATIEPHDDLNRKLSPREIEEGINFINNEIYKKNAELIAEGRDEDVQSFIDISKKRIVLVARFDESKGMGKAMNLGVHTRNKMREAGVPEEELPQIIIVGNGSVDDPSGEQMYEKMLQRRRDQYPHEKDSIVIMRLKHNYAAMNSLMYPTIDEDGQVTAPVVAMQTSDAEGCETRITDWIIHGVPVAVSNRGGMSLQIVEGRSGMVMDFDQHAYDVDRGADYLSGLLSDEDEYDRARQATLEEAERFNSREFGTVSNVVRWLRIFDGVIEGHQADKIWKLSEMNHGKKLDINNPKISGMIFSR